MREPLFQKRFKARIAEREAEILLEFMYIYAASTMNRISNLHNIERLQPATLKNHS